jgi:hypothetical protein
LADPLRSFRFQVRFQVSFSSSVFKFRFQVPFLSFVFKFRFQDEPERQSIWHSYPTFFTSRYQEEK